MAVRQNEHDMLMTGEELRQARAALLQQAMVCVACEGHPTGDNSPCYVCGASAPQPQPKQEVVAWLHPANPSCVTTDPNAYARGIPLVKAPQPQREWVGLSEEVIESIIKSIPATTELLAAKKVFARKIDEWLREKNGGRVCQCQAEGEKT